jgi:hypothetical protein
MATSDALFLLRPFNSGLRFGNLGGTSTARDCDLPLSTLQENLYPAFIYLAFRYALRCSFSVPGSHGSWQERLSRNVIAATNYGG